MVRVCWMLKERLVEIQIFLKEDKGYVYIHTDIRTCICLCVLSNECTYICIYIQRSQHVQYVSLIYSIVHLLRKNCSYMYDCTHFVPCWKVAPPLHTYICTYRSYVNSTDMLVCTLCKQHICTVCIPIYFYIRLCSLLLSGYLSPGSSRSMLGLWRSSWRRRRLRTWRYIRPCNSNMIPAIQL